MRTVALVLISIPICTGCAELRTEYAPRTGEPMRIYDHTTLQTGTQSVATGQDEIRDSSGRLVGTTTHYQNQRVTWTERNYYPMQGAARIDDESFYRITGDFDATHRYENYHRAGKLRSTVGLVVGSIGLGLLVGGIAMYAADSPKTDPMTGIAGDRTALSSVGYVSMIGGLIGAGIGIPLFFAGRRASSASDVRLVDEPERMKFDAQRYNSQQMAQIGPTVY